MNKKLFLILAIVPSLVFAGTIPPAKQRILDSLKLVLQKAAQDTQRVNALNKMGMEMKSFQPDSAIVFIQQALALALKIGYPNGQVAALNQLGIIYKNKAEHQKAAAFLNEGIRLADSAGLSELSAKMSVNLGNIYQRLGDYQKALDLFFTSLKFFETKGNAKIYGGILSNIGVVYSLMEEHDRSMEYYRKALRARDSVNDRMGICNDLGNMAITYSKLWNLKKNDAYRDSAQVLYEKVIRMGRELGDLQSVAHMLNNMAEIFIENGRRGNSASLLKAETHLLEALLLNEQIGDRSGIAVNYNSLAQVYELKGDRKKNEEYRKKAYHLTVELGEIELSREMAYGLYQMYSQQHQYQEALEFHLLYTQWKDSILNEKNQESIRKLETEYETEKKQREIELLTKQNEVDRLSLQQSRYFVWGLSIAGILVLALLVLYINRFISKKKTTLILARQNAEIQEQKAIIEEKNKDILDSIHYARKIQRSQLPSEKYIERSLRGLNH
ncbi:MAG: tetratricopeptide repeat protein [Bacteroidia bacterium]|nr:tetratricopeptide repeat protein [Bacteroidia bacterium]